MEEEHETAIILVIWRGQKLNVEVHPETTLRDFGQKLQHLTNVKPDTIRLLLPKTLDNSSKMLSPFSDEHSTLSLQDFSLLEGKSIRMMGVSEDEIEEVTRNVTKADMRIVGFDEEEKRLRQRSSNRPQASPKLPQGEYIFCDFRTLQLPGIELNPPASEALRRMHMLAADPGIVAIMNKHRWRVGIMTEMAPVGYVGVSPKCILGFNKNHGEEISLRLRTDDLKGFRKYESIKKTLLHELAHMVYSEHDAHFYALDSQLNQEAAQLDWTKSRGHTLSGHRPSDYFDEEYNVEASTGGPQKLGGVTSDQLATARASSVAAAYRRLADISANSLTVHEVRAEPDPDDSILERNLLVENSKAARSDGNWELNQKNDSDKQEKIVDQNASFIGEAMEAESYSHVTGHKIMSEPDPDDSEMAEGPSHSTYKIMSEPDPDDSEMAEALSHSTTNGQFLGPKICGEPDPDDCETANVALVNRAAEPDPDDSLPNEKVDVEAQLRNSAEPDPDDSQLTETGEDTTKVSTANEEPDPDDSIVKTTTTEHENRAEPDPDDSQGNLVIQHEPYPDDPELQHIQDPVSVVCTRLQKAIDTLKSEVNPMEATSILQTLFKIIRNVIENPSETKFKRLRKANPHFQRNVANYKAAMEVLHLVGFNEDTVSDEIGRSETYMVLKRNDPGLLWLAKSSLEMCIAY